MRARRTAPWPTSAACGGWRTTRAFTGARSGITSTRCRTSPTRERLDLLEETAAVLRRLFDGERVTFEGRQVRLADALCDPRPLQPRLRLWIGGQGERRLLRIVARHADGWNAPFLAPEVFADRNATLERWCDRERRDPGAITRTVNLGLALGRDEPAVRRQEENLRLMFGPMTDLVRPGILVGTPAQVIDRIGAYARAGACTRRPSPPPRRYWRGDHRAQRSSFDSQRSR